MRVQSHGPKLVTAADAAAQPPTAPRRRFVVALRRILVGWGCGFAVAVTLAWFLSPGLVTAVVSISVASGMIAVAALAPITWLDDRRDVSIQPAGQTADPSRPTGDLLSAFMLGIIVRLVGTVALFLLCRYQMGQQPEVIAVLVGGWYVFLTSLEVISLARPDAQPDRSDSHDSDSEHAEAKRQIWTTG